MKRMREDVMTWSNRKAKWSVGGNLRGELLLRTIFLAGDVVELNGRERFVSSKQAARNTDHRP